MAGSNNGLTGGVFTSRRCLDEVLFATFIGLAWYNAIELVVICFTMFKRWRGAYFWSLLVASTGIIPYGLGLFLKFFNIVRHNYLGTHTLVTIGWCCMVTGQSMVLWSRLHLILLNQRLLRGILYLIIFDAIIFHIPTAVAAFGTNAPSHPIAFVKAYNVLERVQLVGFCVQETFLSGLYIWGTLKFLRHADVNRYRYILHELLIINVIIIILDGSVVGTQYAGLYSVQTTFKALVYSVKLKLEYAILRKLIKAVNVPRAPERRSPEHPKPTSGTSEHSETEQRAASPYECTGTRISTQEVSPGPSRVLATTTLVFAQNLQTIGQGSHREKYGDISPLIRPRGND
ncbi:hypothetical protein Asppvi_005405 [Aspergillus pseudoviridinutans]|uniref:DUF7703 domain-containing protein n=1 Tax=Aspergillus pseudoviridinutans TaxID=1517512 RepID=A0A9P3ESK2_9EURO|nr:uncharacterized protein Asppvi_005405 [Aspergillus pseudoviridinutans]GIJ86516.1 hypothetical protein Asppvi_005405 [Aspergillus pseudoviridinutans]